MKSLVMTIRCVDLQPGMVLSRDFIINNVKLLNKDVEISPKLAVKIMSQFPQEHLQIYRPDNPDNKSIYKENIASKKVKIEKDFSALSNIAENIFKEVAKSDEVEIKDVRKISEKIMNFEDHGLIMKSIVEVRNVDEYTFRHSVNTAVLSVTLGKWLNLSNNNLKLLCYAGLLHDIGKSKIRPEILNKKGNLNKNEFEEIKRHSRLGYDLVKKVPFIDTSVSLAVLMHHEREDGSGYPLKLVSNNIHPFAKIIAIADTFDAMTSNRVYRSKICPLSVLENIKADSFKQLDPNYCSVFITNMLNFYIGDNVALNNGKLGRIVKLNPNNITKPLVSVNDNFYDLSLSTSLCIEDIL
ncbi:HD-GYP domain-containing protein [Clostridium polynesiense]|uniref:HD-GYP domain-containing protein n=1 Tax=Clostridium polynesiense TaxID=1325933 RepID=UPI000590D69C|nr:HD-GYP domain-containing protein [Clostridium polynesiense]